MTKTVVLTLTKAEVEMRNRVIDLLCEGTDDGQIIPTKIHHERLTGIIASADWATDSARYTSHEAEALMAQGMELLIPLIKAVNSDAALAIKSIIKAALWLMIQSRPDEEVSS